MPNFAVTYDSTATTQRNYVREMEWQRYRVFIDSDEPCTHPWGIFPMTDYGLPTPWLYCPLCVGTAVHPEED